MLKRFTVVALELFVGVTALVGGLLVIPSLPVEWLAGSPFASFTIPELCLTLVGLAALTAAALVAVRPAWGILLSAVVGVAMATFEVVESGSMGFDVWLHALGLGPAPSGPVATADLTGIPTWLGVPLPLWLQPFYFVLGVLIVVLAVRLGALALARRYALASYFVLAFGISWLALFLVVAPSGIPGSSAAVASLMMPAFAVMLLGPSLASIGMTFVESGRPGLRALLGRFGRWRLGPWYAAALITPAVLLVLAMFGSLTPDFVPSIVGSPDKYALVIVSLVWGLGAGFFEELGWTGFATPHLLARYGWLKSGIVLGAVWGTWHLFASYWGASVNWGDLYGLYFVIWCIGSFTAFRVLMTWVYSRTGSLLLAQLMHASFTGGQALLSPSLPPGGTSLVWYVAFAALLWLLVTAVVTTARVHVLMPSAQPHPRGAL